MTSTGGGTGQRASACDDAPREWTVVEWVDVLREDGEGTERHCDPVIDLAELLTLAEVQACLEALHDEFPERVFSPYRLWPVRLLLERCVAF